jgi:ATP-dependent DNA helicase RecQ
MKAFSEKLWTMSSVGGVVGGMGTRDLAEARKVLRDTFRLAEFRPGQERVIQHLLKGHSALAVFPTGGGKSLCYQLPALLLEGVTIVISPLIALMKDQVDFLQSRGIAAARLDSTVSREEFEGIQTSLKSGELRLLFVAPERLSNERFLAQIASLRIALLVIDEAHCISEWGHNFRPDYLKLARLARELRVERVLALTATATPGVVKDVCSQFGITKEGFVSTGFYRPNLFLRVSRCTDADRLNVLISRLKSQPAGPTIVYVTLQKTAETVAEALVNAGFEAEPYHAGMESEHREAVQNRFMASDVRVVVATIAFGMGIDKANIRSVYHFNLPKSLENYSQEIGRAGRDGGAAHCEMLAVADDLTVLENFTYGDTPDADSLSRFVQELLADRKEGETFDISTYDLSSRHDIRQLVVTTALTYLELDGLMEATAPHYTTYQWQYRTNPDDILARFEGERRMFLTRVFREVKVGRTWCTLEIAPALEALQTTRERLVKALSYLEEKGDIELKAAGVRQGYRMKKEVPDLARVVESLRVRFEKREQSDIERVNSVARLVGTQGCLVRRLLQYFGEELGRDCGHCGPCRGDVPVELTRKRRKMRLEDDRELHVLRQEQARALSTPRQVARFLCGVSSPAFVAAKLTRHPRFGSAGATPFGDVLSAAEQVCR